MLLRKLYTLLTFFILLGAVKSASSQDIFDPEFVHEIHFNIEDPDYWKKLEDNYEEYLSSYIKTYIPAQVVIDGTVMDSVGVRFKGHYSNFGFDGNKKPFKLDFNEFKKEQTFQNLKKVNLQNFAADPSFMRDYVAYYLLRDFGVIAPRASFAELYINEKYWGLYLIVEQIDKTFLETHFEKAEGNLFKCVHDTELEDNELKLRAEFDLKTNKSKNDWSSLVNLANDINHPYEFNFHQTLENQFDLDTYLKCLTVDILINNWDSYHINGRNFYLYENPATQKLQWIPWDYNLAFWNSEMQLFPMINREKDEITPLVRILLTNQIIQHQYLQLVCDYISNFNLAEIRDEINDKVDLISPFVFSDPHKFYTNEDFTQNINEGVTVEMLRAKKPTDVFLPGIIPTLSERRNFLFSAINNYDNPCESDWTNENFITVYPNPVNSETTIKIDLLEWVESLDFIITEPNGVIVDNGVITNSNEAFQYSFSNYPSGTYLLGIISNDKSIKLTSKIIVP